MSLVTKWSQAQNKYKYIDKCKYINKGIFLQIWLKGIHYVFIGRVMVEISRTNKVGPYILPYDTCRDKLNDSCMILFIVGKYLKLHNYKVLVRNWRYKLVN